MSYTEAGIVNLALGRIGVKRIGALTDSTPQAIAANAVFAYIRDEVLEAADWKFAKTRATLAKSAITPTYMWLYAYPLPADYLRLAKDGKDDPAVQTESSDAESFPYIIETLSDDSLAILSDFDNTTYNYYVTYIKKVTNPAKWTPGFINALAWRLGAELSISQTEGAGKFEFCMKMYYTARTEAEAMNQSLDYLEDEHGNDSWETVGR